MNPIIYSRAIARMFVEQVRKLFIMADFTGVNAKLDALKVAVDAVALKINTPPVENPAVQAGIDGVATTVDEMTTKLQALASP